MDFDDLKVRLAAVRESLRAGLDDVAAWALPDYAQKVSLLARLSVAIEELGLASERLDEQNTLLQASRGEWEGEQRRRQERLELSPT